MADFNNKISDYSYVSYRCRHLSDLLRYARFGKLDPDWRSNLRPTSAQFNASGLHVSAETAAIAELQMLPLMPWEPNQGTWQRSLDSWYAVAHKTLTLDYVNNAQIILDGMSSGGMAGAYAVSGVLPEKIIEHVVTHDNQGDKTRSSREWIYIGERTSLTGSYLAGLAAGGLDIDWRGWCRDQLENWPEDQPMRARLQSEIDTAVYERIPQYWMNEPTSS